MSTKNYFFAFLMCSLCLAATNKSVAGLEGLSDWSSPSAVTLQSENGPVRAIVRQLSFAWKRSTNQRTERHTVKEIIVPSKSLYWLGYPETGVGDDRQFFVFHNQIIGVAAFGNDVLQFYASVHHLKTNDAHQEVNTIFKEKLDHFESEKFDVEDRQLGMENVLGSFPFTSIPSAQGEPAPTITKIDVDSNSFTIELAGGKDNAVTATITFDNAFKPVKATLNKPR